MSDHIPDVTKMIGETPRTDAWKWTNDPIDELYGFARQLERELNAVSKERDEAVFVTEKVLKEFSEHSRSLCKAIDELNADNSKIELLMSANADVARIADERDAAENRIRLLIAERDTARRQADQTYKLREEFTELLGTDDVEQGVAVVRGLNDRIKRLEEALESIREYWNGDNNSRAMIDACWYAIDKASEALESKERIELLMSANADVARIAAERDAAEKRVMHLEAALRKIADQDYRGNRSTESQIALMALEVKP